jgi:hypothetical protein
MAATAMDRPPEILGGRSEVMWSEITAYLTSPSNGNPAPSGSAGPPA